MEQRSLFWSAACGLAFYTLMTSFSLAQSLPGIVDAVQKISPDEGGFVGPLFTDDRFGRSVAGIGDLDGDGVGDVAVGDILHDGVAGAEQGAVWILFLNADGTVKAENRITEGESGFSGPLAALDEFGSSVAAVGDLDGDGITELAVGAIAPHAGGSGTVWILWLTSTGMVHQTTSFTKAPGYGRALAAPGDLNGDGTPDLFVGDPGLGGTGAVWVTYLFNNGSVKREQMIDATSNGLGGLQGGDHFGVALDVIDDLNGDGVPELVVGAFADDGNGAPGSNRGAVWTVFLNSDQSVGGAQRISEGAGGFQGDLDDVDGFGISVASIGDLDQDGVPDLAVGSRSDDDGGFDRGAVWILFLNSDGTVKSHLEISDVHGGFTGALDNQDEFGISLANLGDLNGDGVPELAVGAPMDDSSASDTGALWVFFLNDQILVHRKIGDGEGGFAGPILNTDEFGSAVASLGDVDGDGVPDMAVGEPSDDDAGTNAGAVWILLLNSDGTVKSEHKISSQLTTSGLDPGDRVGAALCAVGDLDGDGISELAAGGPLHGPTGHTREGAIWILYLSAEGLFRNAVMITEGVSGFQGPLAMGDQFGSSISLLGDLSGDGSVELAVGALENSSGPGAVWILSLNSGSTVVGEVEIGDGSGGMPAGVLQGGDRFGNAVASLSDLDGNGVVELAVGAPFRGTAGAIWILFLNSDGTVDRFQEIQAQLGGFQGSVDSGDGFGFSLAALGDYDGDSIPDLAVGVPYDDDGVPAGGGQDRGAIYMLSLASNGTVNAHRKISATGGGFTGRLHDSDLFGASVAMLGDLDGDDRCDLAVGAPYDNGNSGDNRGAVWILLETDACLFVDYGSGCPGSGNFVPVLKLSGDPTPGGQLAISLIRGLGGAKALFLIGSSAAAIPVRNGCTLLVQPPVIPIGLPLGGSGPGNGEIQFTIPLATSITPPVGLAIQVFVLDPGVPAQYSSSNGTRFTIK